MSFLKMCTPLIRYTGKKNTAHLHLPWSKPSSGKTTVHKPVTFCLIGGCNS